jgi:hypothetical protein
MVVQEEARVVHDGAKGRRRMHFSKVGSQGKRI